MLPGMAECLHQRGIVQCLRVVFEPFHLRQRGAHIADVPTFHDGEVAPHHLAIAHRQQQRARRCIGRQCVLANLQFARRAGLPRQHLPLQAISRVDALGLQRTQDLVQRITSRDHKAVAGLDTGSGASANPW
jgi:hypothetical protein